MEDPAQAKGLVKRDIIRVVTPGTVIDAASLEDKAENFLCGIYLDERGAGAAFCDLSTGKAHLTGFTGADRLEHLINELGRFSPVEAVLNQEACAEMRLVETLREKFHCRIEEGPARRFALAEAEKQARAQFGVMQVGHNSARIGVVDRIFTRIGASDDLSAGQSTFMVEMTEVAEILRRATKHSLLILDEIGRGTSTFDGMSIARAVLEYCADGKTLGAKTLFATHYHELTELEETLPGTVNYNIAVKKRGEEIVFLRKIVPGGADRSYGIEVAKLAGLPDRVIRRAKTVLKELEGEGTAAAPRQETAQVSLESIQEGEILEALRRCQVETLTPMEAMNLLYEWKQQLS